MKRTLLKAVFVGLGLLCMAQRSPARQETATTLQFGGYTWQVRPPGKGGPGPNLWNPGNVWVDKAGLHLKISRVRNGDRTEWQCAELNTVQALGMGTYEFQVFGPIDRLDQNVVLGLFDYPTPDIGPDGTNEIDIEFARWGRPELPIGNYTVYPASGKRGPEDHHAFSFTMRGNITTHRFIRSSSSVGLESFQERQTDRDGQIANWLYQAADKRFIPQAPLPVHINLWLFQGKPPTDAKEVTIIIKKFTFTPAH